VRPPAIALVGAACVFFAAPGARADPPRSGTVDARVLVNPIAVVLVAPSSVPAGTRFPIGAAVANLGRTPVQNVAVTLVAPPGLVLRSPATQVVPRLGARSVRGLLWTACSTTPGSYIVLARAVSGPYAAESVSRLVNVTATARPRC
jgi:hypothetical protein